MLDPMISGITVKNLGCFDDGDYNIKFKKLNVIVGTNNSGKSTIFKGLNLTRWLGKTGNLLWNTQYYTLQGFRESVYGHDLARNIEIQIQYDNPVGTAQIFIDRNNITRRNFVHENRQRLDIMDGSHSTHIEKIWYFSPTRQPISFREVVSSSGDVLQPLTPLGHDIKQYLVERWTDQDPNWTLAQEWFKKIDPHLTIFKTPLYGNQVSLETERNDGNITTSINLSLQGSGLQNITTIIAGIIFSPQETTIIIEEPENFLNSRSIEILVDLFNYAVNELNKQIIIVTHSWEIINAYCSDIGEGSDRGNIHVKANSEDFKLIILNDIIGEGKIQDYDLQGKRYSDVRQHFKDLWG